MTCLSSGEDAHSCAHSDTSDSGCLFECWSPRVSFSKDFVQTESDPHDSNEELEIEEKDSTSEFEFSIYKLDDDAVNVDSRVMLPADQLFLKGKILSLQMPHVQRLGNFQKQEKGNAKDMISIDSKGADVISSVSSLRFSPPTSATDLSPLSPKSTKCSGILTELLGLRKSSVHGLKYNRSCKGRDKPEAVSLNKHPTKSLHLVFNLSDIKASFSRSSPVTEPLLASSYVIKPTSTDSSPTTSISATPQFSNVDSAAVNPPNPLTAQRPSTRSTRIRSGNSTNCLLTKSFSANTRIADQTEPVIWSSTASTSRDQGLAHSTRIPNRENLSLGRSTSKEPSPGHSRHSRALTSGARAGGDSNVGGLRTSSQPRMDPRYLQRSSSSSSSSSGSISNPNSVQKKHEDIRNVRRRVEGWSSYSYSSNALRVPPLLNMPVFIFSAVRGGKGWKKETSSLRFTHLFAWKKQKPAK